MLTAFGHLMAFRFHSKNLAQTTVMSTTFGYLDVWTYHRKNLHRPQSCRRYLSIYLRRGLRKIICTEHSHANSIWPFTVFEVSQQESCTDHSHVYNIWLFRCVDIPQKESAQTTVMSTVFVNIFAQRFEEIICTDLSHVHEMWILTGIEIPQKNLHKPSHVHSICQYTCV